MGLCRIVVDVYTYDTLAVEAAAAAVEYARAHGASVEAASVTVHPGEPDERVESVAFTGRG